MDFVARIKGALVAAALVLLAASCAKEAKQIEDAVERRVLAAHLTTVYKDTLKELPSGSYLMTKKKGDGKLVTLSSSVFVKYSRLNLKNEYDQTNIEEIAKNVGGFSYSNYYGPSLFEIGNYTLSKGMEEAFIGMKEGAEFRVIIPSWASYPDYAGSTRQSSSTTVYDFRIVKVIDDYDAYEIDTLESFSAKYYQGLDSLVTGFYFKHLQEGEGDSIKVGNTISYNYVGRLLDGFVFDTNIEDTARKYRIYQSDRTYTPVSFEVSQIGESNTNDESVVDGFAKALLNMKFGGKAVTFFSSQWGYGEQNQNFGKKQQLHFYIEVLED